jgi:type I restriction enzyme S subunit
VNPHLALQPYLESIPLGWERRRFKFAASLRNEKNVRSDQSLLSLSAEKGIQYRGEGGLGRQAPAEETIATYWKVYPGDVVVNPMWVIEGGVSVSGLSGAVSPAYRVYIPQTGVNPRYLHYLLRSRPYIEQYNQYTRGVTTFDRSVSKEDFDDITVLLPPREEQRHIADFLDAETSRIDQVESLRRRQARLLIGRRWSLFEGLVRKRSSSDLPIRRIVRSVTDGPFGSAFSSSDYVDQGAAVVRLGNIGFDEYRPSSQARISMEMYSQFIRYRVKAGDVLIAALGDSSNHAGRACVAPDLGPAIVKGKSLCARVDTQIVDARYLSMALSSSIGRQSLATQGSTRSMINIDILKSAIIPVPSLKSQREIVQIVDASTRREQKFAQTIEHQLKLLAERRQVLITAAVTGELDMTTARPRVFQSDA